jgi:hypothetical protein
MDSLNDRTGDLQDLFTKLEGISDINTERAQAHDLIGEIVKQAHEFTLATNLSGALQESKLDPSLKKYLPEAIGKLSRYYSATSKLVCAARDRKCSVFHNIRVECHDQRANTSSVTWTGQGQGGQSPCPRLAIRIKH